MNQPTFTPFGPDIEDVAEAGEPLLAGNRADLFEHTDDVRVALVAMFDRALNHINLDAALLHAPGLSGALVECLGELCRKGVRVQVIAHEPDLSGAIDALSHLCAAGITLNETQAPRGMRGWFERRFHRSMQRQLAVVDGQVAWCGPGMRSVDRCTYGPHVCVQGPVVHRLQRLFLETWHASGSHARLPQANYFPPMPSAGELQMGVALPPDAGGAPLRDGASLLEAVEAAQQTVFIGMAMQPPSRPLVKAILAATARGVDVAVLVPQGSLRNWWWRQRCATLLRSPTRVYQADGSCPFPPHCVVDGTWSSLALDGGARRRGFAWQEGAGLIVHDAEFAHSLEAVCRRATLHAAELASAVPRTAKLASGA